MADEFAAVVLAAGRSSRMGDHKLLLPLGGQPLAGYAIKAALASRAQHVLVVLGYEAEKLRAALPPGTYQVVENAHYAAGMATSLRAGIAAVPGNAAGAIILLADQPLLTAAHVNLLLAETETAPDAIVAASYDGRRGNPVYFPRSLFGEVLTIEGDEGGRSIIERHSERLRLVALEPVEATLDVDRPGEYEALVANWERYSRMGSD